MYSPLTDIETAQVVWQCIECFANISNDQMNELILEGNSVLPYIFSKTDKVFEPRVRW